jgi:hypothetical protein
VRLDTQECLVFSRRFLDTPTDGVDWVVILSFYSLLKLYYSVALLGDEIFSSNKGKICVFILVQFHADNCT